MQIKGNKKIIGGYGPTRWTTNEGFWKTEVSFLFSFGDRGIIEDARVSQVSRSRSYYAIRLNGRGYGPFDIARRIYHEMFQNQIHLAFLQ